VGLKGSAESAKPDIAEIIMSSSRRIRGPIALPATVIGGRMLTAVPLSLGTPGCYGLVTNLDSGVSDLITAPRRLRAIAVPNLKTQVAIRNSLCEE